jgi:hypothetical protein
MPPVALRARILQTVAAEPVSPTRRQRSRTTGWIAVLTAAVVAAESLLLLWRRAGPGWFNPWLEVAWAASALGAWWAVRSRKGDLLGAPEWLLWSAAMLSFVGPVWATLVLPRAPVASGPLRVGLWLEPLESSLALGVPILLGFLLTRRHSDPLHPEAQGAAWGALAGSLTALGVGLVFTLSRPMEVVLGQLLPLALLIGFGSTLGVEVLGLEMRVRNRHS